MSITYSKNTLDTSSIYDILSDFKTRIDPLEMYDPINITVSQDLSTISTALTKNSTTYFSFESVTSGEYVDIYIEYKTGSGTDISVTYPRTSDYGIWLASSDSTVMLSLKSPSLILSNVFTVSNDGTNMVLRSFVTAPDQSGNRHTVMYSMSEDSETTYTDGFTPYEDQTWMTLIGVAAHSASKTYVRTPNVYRLFGIQSGIKPIYDQDCDYKRFTLDGFSYLTDGYFCILDK